VRPQTARHLQPFKFMGILDDAIRQHLELKRQHGAEETDLDRLEQEVFGPVARPGDPEFETGEQPAPSSAAAPDDEGPEPAAEEPSDEDPTTVAPQEPSVSPEAEATSASAAEPESVEQPIPEAPEGAIFDVEEVDLGEVDLGDRTSPAEKARIEHADLEDTVDHPAPRVESLSEELEAAAPTPAEIDSGELETFAAPPSEEPGPDDPEVPGSTEEPESLEFDELPGETVEAGTGEHAADDESDEDLLEETPDFLKDAPDGEDLWFEAGKPKDFDFDD
jgi:hypothetical protein